MKLLKFGCFWAVFSCFTISSGLSQSAETATEWVSTDQSRLRLISASEGVKGRDSLRVGLQIQLAPGWKTYWRSPGDAGIPPQFDWAGSGNLETAEILWPLPEKFEAYGFSSWGYHDEIVFPIDIKLKEAGKPLDLKLDLQLGICEDICIPYRHEFTLSLGAERVGKTEDAATIETFVRRVPEKIGSNSATLTEAMANSRDSKRFTVTVESARPLTDPSIIVEGQDGAYFDLLSTLLAEDRRLAVFELEGHLPAKADQMKEQEIMVTIFDKDVAGEVRLRVK